MFVACNMFVMPQETPCNTFRQKKCLVLEPSKRIYISSKIRIDGSGKLDAEEGYKKKPASEKPASGYKPQSVSDF